MNQKTQTKFVKNRHKIFHKIGKTFVTPFFRLKLNYKLEKIDLSKIGPALIISNHVTAFDPLLVGDSIGRQIYYIASEIIFSNGLISRALEYAYAPIPKAKSQTDIAAIKQMIKVAREGGSVGVFVEGNSSFNGELYPFTDSIGKLVLMLKLPLVIFNLKGGYLSKPRWAVYTKRGKFSGTVRDIINYEQYKELSANQISELIRELINIDAYKDSLDVDYNGKKRAEGLQRLLFSCPVCHEVNTVSTKGHYYHCEHCGLKAEYDKRGYLNLPERGKVDLITLDHENLNHYEQFVTANKDFTLSYNGQLIYLFKRRRKRLGKVEISLARNGLTMVKKNKGEITLFPISQIDAVAVQQQAMLIFYIENQPTIAVRLNDIDSPYQMMKTFEIFKKLSFKE